MTDCPPIWNPRTTNSGDGFIAQCTTRSKKRSCKHHREEFGQTWVNADEDWLRMSAAVEDTHGRWSQAFLRGDGKEVKVSRVGKHGDGIQHDIFRKGVPPGSIGKRENWVDVWCDTHLERATIPQPLETATAEDIIESIWLARRSA